MSKCWYLVQVRMAPLVQVPVHVRTFLTSDSVSFGTAAKCMCTKQEMQSEANSAAGLGKDCQALLVKSKSMPLAKHTRRQVDVAALQACY